ncbi:unnamed protein product, partial [Meganyctiphanes norvegica]
MKMASSSPGQKPQSEEISILLAQLGRAIKTITRDVLALLYDQRFKKCHSGKRPINILNKVTAAKNQLKINKQLKEVIESNDINRFDPTAFFLLLRHVCGLAKYPSAAWNENKILTLEG